MNILESERVWEREYAMRTHFEKERRKRGREREKEKERERERERIIRCRRKCVGELNIRRKKLSILEIFFPPKF